MYSTETVRPFRSSIHSGPQVHGFQQKHEEGKKVEKAVQGLFERAYQVCPANRDEQRRGIDMWLTLGPCMWLDGARVPIEVKADFKAAETGNAFIETVSVMQAGTVQKWGWAYTCQSPFLIFCVPTTGKFNFTLYWLRLSDIRAHLGEWEEKYRGGSALNRTYGSDGVLVPLKELERVAMVVMDAVEAVEFVLNDRTGFRTMCKELFSTP